MSQTLLRHVVAQVGPQDIPLYGPADSIYTKLVSAKEVSRLNTLRHLGALSRVFPGVRHARWDYTMAMLYFCSKLRAQGMNSPFRIGNVRFSSQIAALQTIALLWNIGHLPGTYSVEKGIYQYLLSHDRDDPTSALPWPGEDIAKKFKPLAAQILRREDYQGLSRVLSVMKLIALCGDADDDLRTVVSDYAGPFLLGTDDPPSFQWPKLRAAFKLVRHLAYLTLDTPCTGLTWSPRIPALLQQTLTAGSTDLSEIVTVVSEVLSPIERAVYKSIYHSSEARKECAITSRLVYDRLSHSANAGDEILNWMKLGLQRDLRLGRRPSVESLQRVASFPIRSHYLPELDPPTQIELELRKRGFSHPVVLKYNSWNSDALFEPDEVIVDVLKTGVVSADEVGSLILWVMSRFEEADASPSSTLATWQKNEIEPVYSALLSQVVWSCRTGWTLRVQPWPLSDFGLFRNTDMQEGRGGIWASNSRLDDAIARHLFRDRSKGIAAERRDNYVELDGLRKLRRQLRNKWHQKEPRQRWLILMGSVQLWAASHPIIEFDGGLIRLSTRSGKMTLYGMESKTGNQSPAASLRRRLKESQIRAEVQTLPPKHAFVELPLRSDGNTWRLKEPPSDLVNATHVDVRA